MTVDEGGDLLEPGVWRELRRADLLERHRIAHNGHMRLAIVGLTSRPERATLPGVRRDPPPQTPEPDVKPVNLIPWTRD